MSFLIDVQARVGSFELDVTLAGEDRPVALAGPNGSGKTTLLRLIAGAHRPQRGRIVLGGRTLYDSERGVELPPEQRGVGYVPQGYGLFPHLRVLDNVAFALASSRPKQTRAARDDAALQQLDELGCQHLAGRFPGELSGCEQQRVALARALAADPALLLLDEPLAAMDASARRSLRGLLAAHLRARGRPALVATHDVRDVLALDATVCVLHAGRIVQRGSAAELRRAPATDFVAELVGADVG
jgi:ABC-type sulfate/molybdate transport systems ATPase subunit